MHGAYVNTDLHLCNICRTFFLSVTTFTLQTDKFKNLLSKWCNCWITPWIVLHLVPCICILLCMVSWLQKSCHVNLVLSSITYFHFIDTNMTEFYEMISFLLSTKFGDGFIFSWFSIRPNDWFTCPWNRIYTQLGISLVFQISLEKLNREKEN